VPTDLSGMCLSFVRYARAARRREPRHAPPSATVRLFAGNRKGAFLRFAAPVPRLERRRRLAGLSL
jgi:hypothetical protein